MREMTEKQQLVYDCIKESVSKNGYPPTVREISSLTKLSSSTIQFHIQNLEKSGYIKRDPTKPRAIEIYDKDIQNLAVTEITNLPIIGTFAVGRTLFASQNIVGYLPVPIDIINHKESFLLKIVDDSMINAHILKGDMIIVDVESTAENGEIIVALIEDSVTVKRFFKENDHYRLQSENDSVESIIADHVQIIGKVIGVFRLGIN